MAKKYIPLGNIDPVALLGELDKNLKILSRKHNATIILRDGKLLLQGELENVILLRKELLFLIKEVKKGKIINLDAASVPCIRDNTSTPKTSDNSNSYSCEQITTPKTIVKPRTEGQFKYLQALDKFDVVVCIGPAGTGKTYLAVAKAVESLREGKVHRIILARPAIEAGEKLGFLPGDFKEKVDPYLRPLYDALYELVPADKIRRYLEERVIEVIPLAYMRGRNLDNSFIILDEAQNAKKMQMKMFLTRIGVGSKICINGDITQIDLQSSMDSGLEHIQHLLKDIPQIKFVYLSDKDIVRHPLVIEIVKAYERESYKQIRNNNH